MAIMALVAESFQYSTFFRPLSPSVETTSIRAMSSPYRPHWHPEMSSDNAPNASFAIRRRHFIQAVTASVLLPACAWRRWDYVLFDERFEQARRVAASWSAPNRLIKVRSDVTAFWCGELDRLARHQHLSLRGVTTDSFLFCLRILLAEHANLDVQVSRLDLNLLSWSVHASPFRKT
jgi:hypothetical protein